MATLLTPRRMDAQRVYYILEGASALFLQLTITIYIVFYSTTAGLDLFQIMLAASVFEATIFLFEIPTGILADVYSRRLSIIIGVAMIGSGFVVMGLFPMFIGILLGEILQGIGSTFMSGATEAWISDEIGAERANKAFVRAAQIRTLGGMMGTVISVLLASIHLRVPVLSSGALLIGLAIFLVLFMPENGFQRTPQTERSTWHTMRNTFRKGLRLIRVRPMLIVILAIAVLFAFHTEGFDHLWQLHFLDNFTLPSLGMFNSVAWLGIIGIAANLLSLALNEVVRRCVDLNDHAATARTLRLVYGVLMIGIIVFALTTNFALALAVYLLIAALRSISEPINTAWFNQNVDSHIRATMFSMRGQVHSLGEIFAGPPTGIIGNLFSVRAALIFSGAVLSLTLGLFAFTLRRETISEAE
jgi:MFS transporter, DHA3 family, tetracycline resistance protein